MSDIQKVAGTIWAVFGHRLAIQAADGRRLVDLGPKGAEGLILSVGDAIIVTGEKKPSEIKVSTLALNGGAPRAIAWDKKPGHKEHSPADPAIALKSVKDSGYRVEGDAKRKPKHFEVRGEKNGAAFELHVELDGAIRKAKPLAA